jgi:3-hydroxyisobutyrate dehydrogenase-like beta-hydroxyacid dehydrogenase
MVGAKRPMLDGDDYTGTTFSLELMAKDLRLAVEAAGGGLAVTQAVLAAAQEALDAGHDGEDFAAIAGHLAAG